MLNSIRSQLKGVAAWIFAIVGIAAFSVVGVPNLANFGQRPPIKVGGQAVNQQEIADAFNRELQRLQSEANRTFTRDEAIATGLPQRVVADIAARTTVMVEADKLGITMPRDLVREILGRDETFQNRLSGEFDETVLLQILQQNNLTLRQFDQLARSDMKRQQLITAISAGGRAPRALVDFYVARETEQRKISWLTITPAMAGAIAEPTPEDLQSWYDTNAPAYTNPEYRTFSIAYFRSEDFSDGMTIEEDELRQIYEINRERLYEQPERRTLYQLTYENEADAIAAVDRLRDGVPFETLAIEKGISLAAATLENTSREEMLNQEVAAAAFTAENDAGTILNPVSGIFGSTIVQIVEVTPAETQSFDEVREAIEQSRLAQETQQLIIGKLEEVEEQRDSGISLKEAAEIAEVKFTTVGPMDRFSLAPGGNPIIDNIPAEALEEAFALEEGEESDAIELGNNAGYVLLSVDEITPPTVRPYEDVAADVETAWQQNARRMKVTELANSLAQRVKDGEDLSAIADEFERTPITETLRIANPSHDSIASTLHDTIFDADIGSTVTGNANSENARIVVTIEDISFARGDISGLRLEAFRDFVGNQINQELLNAYINTLQETHDVQVNQTVIDRIFSPDSFQ